MIIVPNGVEGMCKQCSGYLGSGGGIFSVNLEQMREAEVVLKVEIEWKRKGKEQHTAAIHRRIPLY